MSKNTFKDYICKPYCVYFKEGEKEEMACYGAIIGQRLVKERKLSPFCLEKEPEKKDTRFKDDEDIIQIVCANCPFENDDCDFRSDTPPKNVTPCGGYIFLYRLKTKGLITANNLRKVCIG